VRREDVAELIAETVAIGSSVVALSMVIRVLRRRPAGADRAVVWLAAATAVSSVIVCVALWIDGSRGGWAPPRPLPYDPVPAAWGHGAMVIGVVIGLLIALLVPLARRRPDTPSG
jgi:hypothetical protein